MRVLVVGGGGREHAICAALAAGDRVDRLYAAPGNPGIGELAALVPCEAGDTGGIAAFAEAEGVDLVVVGPEAPLVAGMADELARRGIPVFGPTRAAARLEGSKAWAKRLCESHGIPAARSWEFRELGPARDALDRLEPPFVIKADGLAAGKGVTVAEDRAGAERALEACLVDRAFGDAGATVLVEEFLEGPEVSALAVTDGRTVVPLALAQDHKRALDGDRGPNTGGMGAYSPLPFVDEATEKEIRTGILEATVAAMREEGVGYLGVLYAGLILTADGPKVLEYNCRFGDPETQVILPRLASSLDRLLAACVDGSLGSATPAWRPEACVGVVLASGGYPGPSEAGRPIDGLAEAAAREGVGVFHSGTAARDGRVVTAGGRVLTVSALGPSLEEARDRAYEAVSLISFDGMQHRTDIATSRWGAG